MCLTRLDFYPRSPCGERPNNLHISEKWARISIHALLAESDGDGFVYCDTDSVFLSTLSLRRATVGLPGLHAVHADISIHALLAESDWVPRRQGLRRPISIHALLAESDVTARIIDPTYGKISIHALLAESDPFSRSGPMTHRYFYPRSPCGERLNSFSLNINGPIFLSTLSLRRATFLCYQCFYADLISIHALLAESDTIQCVHHHNNQDFYPRSPCGERRPTWAATVKCTLISIHALLAESDSDISLSSSPSSYFYPRSPCGERLPCFLT